MPPHITGLRGEQANRQFPLGDTPITFGRNPDNSIVLTSGRSSRHHAEIRRIGVEYVLTDLGSANGTFVNGQRLNTPYGLRPGDTFDIGDDTFRFDAPPEPALGKTLVATPPAPQSYQPAQPPPPATTTTKSNRTRTILIMLGVIALVLVVACIGGIAIVSRNISSALTTMPSTPASNTEATPQPVNNAPIPTREPVAGTADWTVLVYLDGDNSLEPDAITDFNEMEQAGSNDRVNIVVQFDRTQQEEEDDTSNGDWTTTKRFLVQQDNNSTDINSQELADLGELNMGDPQTLADFITWGIQTYPAQRYALVLWDHGSSWAGIAFDDTSDQKGITMPELSAALRTAQNQTGVEKLDLIGFDACLMSQIDVFQTIAPYGKVVVASAEIEPNDGWAWDAWLKELNQDPSQEATTVGQLIVKTYADYYTNSVHDTVTLAAFDLTKIDAVRDGLNTLADAMISDLNNSYPIIAQARSVADAYSQPKPETFSAVDLGDFSRLLSSRGSQNTLNDAAQALLQQIAAARLSEWHNSFHTRSTGISIFFPQVPDLYPDLYDSASPIPRDTSWGQFLRAFYEAGGQQVNAPLIDNLDLSNPTVGVGNPVTVNGQVTGKDIAYIFSFIGVPNSDRSGVELTHVDYIYPPGSSPNAEIPPWDNGTNYLSETWDGTRWELSNGSETIPVLLGPTKYGTDLYGVEGIYTFKDSQRQIVAGLLFKVNQGRATLQQINGFPTSQSQETQPFEITPTAGDTFTAMLRTYTMVDGRPVPDFNQGQTITIGNDALSAVLAPAANGDYVAGFLVRDIAGHFSYQYIDIFVDNSNANAPTPSAQAPSMGPGSTAGSLAYQSVAGQFALEYPDTWQVLDTGKNQIYFYDPSEASQSFLDVQYLVAEQASIEQTNLALLQAYQNILSKEQDFQVGDIQPFRLANQDGQSFNYRYTDQNGLDLSGVAIAVTSPTTGMSYIVTVQALSETFDSEATIFDQILGTFQIT